MGDRTSSSNAYRIIQKGYKGSSFLREQHFAQIRGCPSRLPWSSNWVTISLLDVQETVWNKTMTNSSRNPAETPQMLRSTFGAPSPCLSPGSSFLPLLGHWDVCALATDRTDSLIRSKFSPCYDSGPPQGTQTSTKPISYSYRQYHPVKGMLK